MADPDLPRIEIDDCRRPPGGGSDTMDKPLDKSPAVIEKLGLVADEESARVAADEDLVGSRKQASSAPAIRTRYRSSG